VCTSFPQHLRQYPLLFERQSLRPQLLHLPIGIRSSFRNILQRNAEAPLTNCIAKIPIYPAFTSPCSGMTNTLNPPIFKVAMYKLRIRRYYLKRQVNLRSIELSNKIQQPFADANALKVRQNHKTANSIIIRPHPRMRNRNETHRPALVNCHITPNSGAKLTVQIMMFPKHLPHLTPTLANRQVDWRVTSFFLLQ